MTKTHAEFLEELRSDIKNQLQYSYIQRLKAHTLLKHILEQILSHIEQFQAEQKVSKNEKT